MKTAKTHIQRTSHDAGIDQTQIEGLHKIIKTDANVCLTNSETKYTCIQIKMT